MSWQKGKKKVSKNREAISVIVYVPWPSDVVRSAGHHNNIIVLVVYLYVFGT